MKNNIIKTGLLLGIITIIGQYIKSADIGVYVQYLLGLGLGYVLSRASIGFMMAIRAPYMKGDSEPSRNILILFLVTALIMTGVHYSSIKNGGVVAHRATDLDTIIPGTPSVKSVNMINIIGYFIFGIGMAMGGGCASGVLRNIGEGRLSGFLVLVFFGIGGILSQRIIYDLNTTILGKTVLDPIYLPEHIGFIPSLLITGLLLLGIYYFLLKYEEKRKYQRPQKYEKIDDQDLTVESTLYNNIFIKNWSPVIGVMLISILFGLIVITSGKSWGVSTAYNHLAFWISDKLGIVFKHPGYQAHLEVARKGMVTNTGVMRNIGTVLGVILFSISTGNFELKNNIQTLNNSVIFIIGGFLMGLGARMGSGCNVGAVYAGISNFGINGWIALLLVTLGGIVGLKIIEDR